LLFGIIRYTPNRVSVCFRRLRQLAWALIISTCMNTGTATARTMLLLGIMLGVVAGCAAKYPADRVYSERSTGAQHSGALALVFDPGLTAYSQPLDLDRVSRGQAAYVGFDSVTTYVYTRQDDSQLFIGNQSSSRHRQSSVGYLGRQSVTETVGTRQR
jgi:hypothetical protein